jgi:UDP-N-acetylmuramyl tripeptide synthase
MLIAALSGWVSKTLLRKSGKTIPGKVLLQLYPKALQALSNNRTVLLVSGTNGKTSTTKALSKAVSSKGPTVSNSTGSNLDRGAATTLMSHSKFVVLEVDELHLTKVASETKPKVVLLLNLSRDQLHRMHEVKRVADRWHQLAATLPETTFVGDVDDPFVAYALSAATNKIGISFGGKKHKDGAVCPACGKYMKWNKNNYKCSCGLTNTNPDQEYENGSAAYRNSVLANVAGSVIGTKPIAINEAELERSVVKDYKGVIAKLRLTKNPASWEEALRSVSSQDVVLIVNARQVDGIDTSWLWDISFETLRNRRVIVTGERALDIAYRLHVQGIKSEQSESFEKAISKFTPGSSVDVLAAYTAYFGLVGA